MLGPDFEKSLKLNSNDTRQYKHSRRIFFVAVASPLILACSRGVSAPKTTPKPITLGGMQGTYEDETTHGELTVSSDPNIKDAAGVFIIFKENSLRNPKFSHDIRLPIFRLQINMELTGNRIYSKYLLGMPDATKGYGAEAEYVFRNPFIEHYHTVSWKNWRINQIGWDGKFEEITPGESFSNFA